MSATLVIGFLCLLGFVLLLNLFALPANWMLVGLALLWRFLNPNPGDMGLVFFATLIGLALLGEVVEYIAQGWGTKKYGSTTGGMFAGLICAFVGALVGLPFLFGFGALIGAFLGAWGGCYALERFRGRTDAEAARAAKGALVGRFLGIVIKCALGVFMLGMVYDAVWPTLSALPETLPLLPAAPQPAPPGVTAL